MKVAPYRKPPPPPPRVAFSRGELRVEGEPVKIDSFDPDRLELTYTRKCDEGEQWVPVATIGKLTKHEIADINRAR